MASQPFVPLAMALLVVLFCASVSAAGSPRGPAEEAFKNPQGGFFQGAYEKFTTASKTLAKFGKACRANPVCKATPIVLVSLQFIQMGEAAYWTFYTYPYQTEPRLKEIREEVDAFMQELNKSLQQLHRVMGDEDKAFEWTASLEQLIGMYDAWRGKVEDLLQSVIAEKAWADNMQQAGVGLQVGTGLACLFAPQACLAFGGALLVADVFAFGVAWVFNSNRADKATAIITELQEMIQRTEFMIHLISCNAKDILPPHLFAIWSDSSLWNVRATDPATGKLLTCPEMKRNKKVQILTQEFQDMFQA